MLAPKRCVGSMHDLEHSTVPALIWLVNVIYVDQSEARDEGGLHWLVNVMYMYPVMWEQAQ